MSKKTLILVTAAFAAVIVIALLFFLTGGGGSAASSSSRESGEGGGFLSGPDRSDAGSDRAERQKAEREALIERLRELQRQPGNLTRFLTEWRQHCQEEPLVCDALLQEALAEYPDREFAGMVARLLSRLPGYEQAMQSLVMSTALSPRERYDRLWALREQMLGREEAVFAFGQERAYADYQFRYGDLLARAGTLTPEQRSAELQKLREAASGEYSRLLAETEGPAGAYERERDLLLAGVTDADLQARITAQLRRRYFDAATVAQMEARDVQLADQAGAVARYQSEATALRQELEVLRPGLGEAAWEALYEQRMTELRLRHFP